ncbi:hypothetical protein ACS0TY_032147 [Phlomoides rotata]
MRMKISTMKNLRSKVEELKEYLVCGFAFVFIMLLVVGIYGASKPVNQTGSEELVLPKGNYAPSFARKLLTYNFTSDDYGDDQGDGGNVSGSGGDVGDSSGSGGDVGDGSGSGGDDRSPNRIGMGVGPQCSKNSILVFQGPTSPLPNGIPTYSVDIQNVCMSDSCSIAEIHVSCGWFSSARLIDPSVFRRVNYNDCLVNDGRPLVPGDALSFQYANTYKYPMSVTSVAC